MRDPRWVAEHRGGPLKKEQHYQLINWALACVKHVLPLLGDEVDLRLTHALQIAREWANDKTTVGTARKASVECHACARESMSPVKTAIARAIGHAVATAHAADHSLGGALYSLKAISLAGKSVDAERKWQISQLEPEIRNLVLSTMAEKERHFKLGEKSSIKPMELNF